MIRQPLLYAAALAGLMAGAARAEQALDAQRVLPGEAPTYFTKHEPADSIAASTPYRGLCTPGSELALEAAERVDEVSQKLRSMASTASLKPFRDAFRDLGSERCLQGVDDVPLAFNEASVRSVKAWWFEGGERWARSFLERGHMPRSVLLPPELPPHLEASKSPLVPHLLCPSDAPCDADTVWRRRVQWALPAPGTDCIRSAPPPCEVKASLNPEERYTEWLSCMEGRSGKEGLAFPVEALRLPSEGWLTTREVTPETDGVCLRTGVYSLADGRAWRTDTCGGPALMPGSVPVGLARDLALLLALRGDLRTGVRTQATEVALPEGLQPAWYHALHWEGGPVSGGSVGWRMVGVVSACPAVRVIGLPPQAEVHWRVRLEGAQDTGTLALLQSCDPLTQLSLRWAGELARAFQPGETSCSALPPEESWAPLDPESEHRTVREAEQRIAERFSAQIARCSD